MHGDDYAELDRSLAPRSPAMLYDVAAGLGLSADSAVLDLGSGRGNHSLELARRFGCRVYGLDLALSPLVRAESHPRVAQVNASALELPFKSGCFDLVWCRDMLVHVTDLKQVFLECKRVLKPGGRMLIFATWATELMEPAEADRLYQALAIVARNLSPEYFQGAVEQAGLHTYSVERIGSELIEYYEETDGRVSRELLRIARMRRAGARFKGLRYESASAVYHWLVYLLLGKLESVVITLRK